MLLILLALGLSGLLTAITLLLFLLQITIWAFGFNVNLSDLLRSFIAITVPLRPLKVAAYNLIFGLLCCAAVFYYAIQTSSPAWIISIGALLVFFGQTGRKLLCKASLTKMVHPAKEILELLFTAMVSLGVLWTGLSVWYLKDLPQFM